MRKTCITALAGLLIAGVAQAVVVDFTAGEGYADGDNLGWHPDWLAQDQWKNDNSVGDGVVRTPVGDFIRGHYTGLTAGNGIGAELTIGATFNMVGNMNVSTNVDAGWKEGIYTLDVTEQLTSTAPSGRMEGGIYMSRTSNELQLKAGGQTAVIGNAADFDGHSWALSVSWTKTTATDYAVEASIDSLDDAAGAWTVSGTATPAATLSGAPTVQAFFKALPTAGLNYSGVEVDQFTVVPEPATIGLLGLSGLAIYVRRKFLS